MYNIIISCDGSSFTDKDSSLGKTGAAAIIVDNQWYKWYKTCRTTCSTSINQF